MSFVLFLRRKGNERNLKVQGVRIKNATIMHASRVLHFFLQKYYGILIVRLAISKKTL